MSEVRRYGINPFPQTPSGGQLPIPCVFKFGPGPNATGMVPPVYDRPVPPGYRVEWIKANDPRITDAGFEVAQVWISEDGTHAVYEEQEGYKIGSFLYLINEQEDPEEIEATWDEGRWWTPDESDQFMLMLQVPATIDVTKLGPHGEYGEGRR